MSEQAPNQETPQLVVVNLSRLNDAIEMASENLKPATSKLFQQLVTVSIIAEYAGRLKPATENKPHVTVEYVKTPEPEPENLEYNVESTKQPILKRIEVAKYNGNTIMSITPHDLQALGNGVTKYYNEANNATFYSYDGIELMVLGDDK